MKFLNRLFLVVSLFLMSPSSLFVDGKGKKGKKTRTRKGQPQMPAPQQMPQPPQQPQGRTAVTMWMVVFNTPGGCTGGTPGAGNVQCSPADVFGTPYLNSVAAGTPNPSLISTNAAAGIGVVHATGGISDTNGNVFMTAAMYRQLAGGALNLDDGMDPMNLNRGWDAADAEIHFVIRTHGNVVFPNDGFLDQILNFLEPYCSDPNLASTGAQAATGNVCADIQIIETPASAASNEFGVRWLDGSGGVTGSRASFKRRGDGVQIVVNTNVLRRNNIFGGF